jgi:hypothetical protein
VSPGAAFISHKAVPILGQQSVPTPLSLACRPRTKLRLIDKAGAAAVQRAKQLGSPHVAAVFGVNDHEPVIRWLIALMVLCCDPLAIVLTAATSARR